jgi:hypothetical protein
VEVSLKALLPTPHCLYRLETLAGEITDALDDIEKTLTRRNLHTDAS